MKTFKELQESKVSSLQESTHKRLVDNFFDSYADDMLDDLSDHFGDLTQDEVNELCGPAVKVFDKWSKQMRKYIVRQIRSSAD